MIFIEKITSEIMADSENAWATDQGWMPIFTAHEDARILIIGQAPGRIAQEKKRPFDDPSGVTLRKWLGVDEAQFYNPNVFSFLPMDFYFPGQGKRGDIPPRKGFAKKWHPPLMASMPNIALTLLIGIHAQGYYLPNKSKTLTETVKRYAEYGPQFFPIVHPSPRNNIWHKKNPWFVDSVVPALQSRVTKLVKSS